MKFIAVIEIPKGCDRRIHMSTDKSGFIDLGPIKDRIPINDGIMPVNYGYFENIKNKDEDEDDDVDVLVFSSKKYKTGDKVKIEVFGMITREDGDHKILATDGSIEINAFSEINGEERKLILDYFGFKSKPAFVDGIKQATSFLNDCIEYSKKK
ncbi:inorganic diphosphatase [Candidatus Woesearchaeota archaeon]|nr:inorganic diphosphatase [Candidatus Woesearchaeota archaeon]